ncbi:NADH-quinone oxidoreductase subunit L [Verrucomicrobiota bacterium sgz303538]
MDANIPWFILLCPLLSAAIILLFTKKSREISALISVFAVCFAFLGSLVLFFSPTPHEFVANRISWIDLGSALQLPLGTLVDPLSKVMLLVVTGIGALVHIYSLVYMGGDEGESRYFAGLSLFMFSMLGIVLADNFVMMFIFWELVGVSSYLLIGHWFTREAAAKAANKAFITNRLGDFGFMLGILLVFISTGAVTFDGIRANLQPLLANPTFLTVTAICIFAGAVGKSAQFPLHVWLPDAMEGPTPVSALIHAATMVAAGVYMLVRVFFIVGQSPTALTVIAAIGIITAVLAALIATQQDDIKRILAYSTLSQLGYMVAAVGVAAPGAAMFHLFTHAFFKACLFLGAGAVIHALHHEQNIWRMGGLRARMPKTFLTFAVATLALTGCPFLAGFFSKDAILLAAWNKSPLIFWLGLFSAFLTAFYMTRLVAVAFLGKARTHEAEHGHDGPAAMTFPLIVLGVLSVIAGYGFFAGPIFGHEFMEQLHATPHVTIVPVLATGAFLLGTAIAWVLYANRAKDPILVPFLKKKFYFDEFYGALIAGTQDLLARLFGWFDKWVLDGVFVRGLSGLAWGSGFGMRFLQFGNLQGYAFVTGLAVVALIYFMVFR